jgi:hypothetical protein
VIVLAVTRGRQIVLEPLRHVRVELLIDQLHGAARMMFALRFPRAGERDAQQRAEQRPLEDQDDDWLDNPETLPREGGAPASVLSPGRVFRGSRIPPAPLTAARRASGKKFRLRTCSFSGRPAISHTLIDAIRADRLRR